MVEVLAPFRPLQVVVETCPFWPWIHGVLVPAGIEFHLAHAKELRFIANTPQKKDAVDAALLARMLLSGLIPEVYPRPPEQRALTTTHFELIDALAPRSPSSTVGSSRRASGIRRPGC